MTDRLEFDDRLLNRYAVEDLAASHPALHAALATWFSAFGDFDDASLGRLIAARSPDDVDRWKAKGEAALASIPGLAATLDAVLQALEAARPGEALDLGRLEGLREAARINRTMLVERAPALVAAALASAGGYQQMRAGATAAVEQTAERLEALRGQAADGSRSYRELQPLLAELQSTWQALHRSLSGLSRADQRAVQAPLEPRMLAAARALTRDLFLAKMRDRAAGTWPTPEIPGPGAAIAEQFAAALARGDVAGAHGLLAPWLARAWSVEHLAATLHRAAREIATEFELPEAPPVAGYQVDRSPLRYADLRSNAAAQPVPAEVTEPAYRGWFRVELQTEAEDAYLTDVDHLARLDLVIVDTPEGERIGHLAFEA